MVLRILIAVPVLIASLALDVRWANRGRDKVSVFVTGNDELISGCLNGGLTMTYRFEVSLCERATLWFDDCEETRKIVHSLTFDPISGQYSFTADALGDRVMPETERFESERAAKEALRSIRKIPVLFLAHGNEEMLTREDLYLDVRIESFCNGDYNKTLDRISNILTLGLVHLSGFSAIEKNFALEKE